MRETRAMGTPADGEPEPDGSAADATHGVADGDDQERAEPESGGPAPATGWDGRGGEEEARLFLHGRKTRLRGRTLQLVLWLAAHQRRINAVPGESGELWLTWKGHADATIAGRIQVRL